MRRIALLAAAGAAMAFAAEAGAATVTITRDANDYGAGQRVVCLLDSSPAAILAQGQSERVSVADGPHKLYCQAVSGGFTPTPTATLDVRGDQALQFSVSLSLTRVHLEAK
ncbi:MAG: hypothetical protein IJ164_05200 [Duodenibacillus sp.]|nr:hypothetical protein [Duodenibacillus sp.]